MIVSTVLLTGAVAKSAYEDFEKQSSVEQNELEKFRAVLNGDDPERRLRAMQFMIKSGNPILARAAREFGLFAVDPALQNQAVRAIFNSGAHFRLQMDAPGEKGKYALKWMVRYYSGAHDGKNGSASLIVGKWDPKSKCWLRFYNTNECFLRLKGTSINMWLKNAQASFTLGDDGVFRGRIRTSYTGEGWANVSIDLTEQ